MQVSSGEEMRGVGRTRPAEEAKRKEQEKGVRGKGEHEGTGGFAGKGGLEAG